MTFLIRPARRMNKQKNPNRQEILDRLENYLKGNYEEPIQILCGFWKDQQEAITYQELREAVMAGTLNEDTFRLWSQDYSRLLTDKLQSVWEEAMQAGSVSQQLMQRAGFEFDTQKVGVVKWIQRRGAEFVTSVTQEQKQAIQSLLVKSVIEGHSTDELARFIRPCIGLTEAQAKANLKYYDNIVATLKKEHPRMKLESIRKKAKEAAVKYAERQHRQRAMTIAQTEMVFAYNKGADEAIRQAQAQGMIGTVRKRWSTSGDDGVCDICNSLDGIEVDLDSDFSFKGKVLFMGHHRLPPAHPRCACAVEYIETSEPLQIPTEIHNMDEMSGLSAGVAEETGEGEGHEKPNYLGSLDDTSEDMIKSTLEKYELDIVKSDIENAVVITKTGLVFQCYGNKNGVYPNLDLGEELIGASVTHNHPIGSSNEYSFSNDDINLFISYGLKLLRGIDERYIYEFSRNPLEIDNYATMEEMMNSDGDLARHEAVIARAEELGIGYRRWKR